MARKAKAAKVEFDWSQFDPAAIFVGIINGLELQRQAALRDMVKSKEVDPTMTAALFAVCDWDYRRGRTFEQRFSSVVGQLSATAPWFKRWWNLMNRRERLAWRLRHDLGGSRHPRRLSEAVQS